MKFKVIDRQRYLANTPALKWIRTIAYSTVALSSAYSVYFYYYKGESFNNAFNEYTKDFNTEIALKRSKVQNKPLEKNAYRNYLKEKKYYEAQLLEETKIRLERIKNQSLDLPETPAKPETQAATTPVAKEVPKKKSWLSYLSFGLLGSSKKD